MVLADQVRDWCATPDTQIVVKPVIDLAGHIDVDSYHAPDRLADQTRLLNPTCVFPSCRRLARACDLDHNHPHAQGGRTCSCQLAPLCRRHHRAKTFDRWRYQRINPTTVIWTSPHGLMFHRDHHGTTRIGQPTPPHGCHMAPGQARSRHGCCTTCSTTEETPGSTTEHTPRSTGDSPLPDV